MLQVEMTCIKAACRMELGRELPVTFLVVQKRHHTRFFPINKNDMDRKGNVLPGTVVDTEITHPTQADFYLVSHASLQVCHLIITVSISKALVLGCMVA